MLTYATLFFIAFLITFLLTPLVRRAACRAGMFDLPDGRRKLHAGPIPRFGGVAVVAGFYAALFLLLHLLGDAAPAGAAALAVGMLGPALLVAGIGFADDLWSVRPVLKVAFQVAAGLWVYYVLDIRIELLANPLGGESMLGALSLPATLIWIVLVTNAFNLVDGMDGLASGISLIAAICVFTVSLQLHNAQVAFFAVALAGAVLGFLRYNFNPATIFLGDTGSLFLGFQLAVLSMAGSQKSSTAIAVAAPILMLAMPLLDTVTSMMRRFLRGEPIMQADRGHIHHQLIRMGLTPRRAVLSLYLGAAAFGVISLFLVRRDGALIGLIAVALSMVTWVVIQKLGYAEFAEINSAFKRVFLYQRRVIRHNLLIGRLADDLRSASSLSAACDLLAGAAQQLGFSHLLLRCGQASAGTLAYAGANGIPNPARHTVMSIVLAGSAGEVGEVVLARSRKAEPLHSALPTLLEAITSSLPAIVEDACTRREPGVADVIQVYPPAGPRPRFANPYGTFASAPRPVAFPRPAVTAAAAATAAAASAVDVTLSSHPCPQCDGMTLARSHSRTMTERIRKLISRTRLHRCSECGWRGWVFVLINVEEDVQVPQPTPDLVALDDCLGHAQPLRVAL